MVIVGKEETRIGFAAVKVSEQNSAGLEGIAMLQALIQDQHYCNI
jgi:hypothetical protein